ncbi:membrane protein [soil metagenome]
MEEDAGTSRLTSAGAASLSRKWLGAIAVVLTMLAGAMGAGCYLLLGTHRQSQALAGAEAAAIAVAKACVAATQPPDLAGIPASQHELSVCATGDFATQTAWYGEILGEAYQAVNVRVRVPEIHAAVERHNADGSIVALVAFHATVSQAGMPDRDNSYRMRVRLVLDNGQFKVTQLDQVAK